MVSHHGSQGAVSVHLDYIARPDDSMPIYTDVISLRCDEAWSANDGMSLGLLRKTQLPQPRLLIRNGIRPRQQ